MDLFRVANIVRDTMLSSSQFPYKTGYLHDNFFDKSGEISTDTELTLGILSEPTVYYGKILENAPSIRYKLRKDNSAKGNRYTYIRHNNRHFRYIDRIIEDEVISAIESEFGVKRV